MHQKAIAAAMGVRISATGLEGAVAGTPLLRREKEDSLEELKSTGLFYVLVGLFCVVIRALLTLAQVYPSDGRPARSYERHFDQRQGRSRAGVPKACGNMEL